MEVKSKPRLHASWIDFRAKEIVRRLQDKGHTTYLVGGCVRDLLVGLHPKDYDIATSALPNDVKKLIPAAYIIGKRFRLVLVRRGAHQFEVATFRRAQRAEDTIAGEDAPMGDNFFGTPEEDAIRRDFTVNALFYDPIRDELIDYAHALADIETQTLRMIGDPATRIKEDPIRSLRAIRFAHKVNFKIEPQLRQAIADHTAEVASSILPRRREEYLKILRLKSPIRALLEMWDLGLLQACLPSLIPIFEDPERLAIFTLYMNHIDEICLDKDLPVELYTPVVLAFDQATADLPDLEERRDEFCRVELGLFKAESADIQGVFETKPKLQTVESFKKRGVRRQQAFLAQANLPIALRIAAFERELSAPDLWFWTERLGFVNSSNSLSDSSTTEPAVTTES